MLGHYASGVSRRAGELPLPQYGLAGSFNGERFIEGYGWDLWTIVHRPVDSEGELTVGVTRRTTASPSWDAPRVAISEELARESFAITLVLDLPGMGDDLYEIAAEVALEDDAWRPREVRVDGEAVAGYERDYGGMWILYYLTPMLIVHVQAPLAMRPDAAVELRKLRTGEVALRHDWPT